LNRDSNPHPVRDGDRRGHRLVHLARAPSGSSRSVNDAVVRLTDVRSVRRWDRSLDRADEVIHALVDCAQREGVTHVIFGQSARLRWEVLWRGSTIDRFLSAVPDAAVQVVPLSDG
jgi:hypothetical protein